MDCTVYFHPHLAAKAKVLAQLNHVGETNCAMKSSI